MESTRKHCYWLAVGLWMVSPALADNPPFDGRSTSALANGALEIAPARMATTEEAFANAIDSVTRRAGNAQASATHSNSRESTPNTNTIVAPVASSSETTESASPAQTNVGTNVRDHASPEAVTVIPRRNGHTANQSPEREASSEATTLPHRGSNLRVPWYRSPFVALAGVLVLIVGLTVAARRYLPAARPVAPDALAVVGRTAISAKQSAVLLHVGNRVVLVGVTAERVQTLAEITEPEEVAMLLGKTRGKQTADQSFDRALAKELDQYDDSEVDAGDTFTSVAEEYRIPLSPASVAREPEEVSDTLRIARGELASLRTRINELQSA